MNTLKNFAAIDFETANFSRSSICSVGIVIVREGVITDRLYRLIRPNPNYYNKRCVGVHGLTSQDTDSAQEFVEVWNELSPKIAGLPLVAHNSSFDESCLKSIHEVCRIPYPNYKFHCTYRAAAREFKGLADHKLPTVSAHCGFVLDNHHNAIADAEACAHIALKIL